jgi:hypothetical protein
MLEPKSSKFLVQHPSNIAVPTKGLDVRKVMNLALLGGTIDVVTFILTNNDRLFDSNVGSVFE